MRDESSLKSRIPESTYVTIHSKLREDWCEWWTIMVANLNVFKTCYPNRIFFRRSSLGDTLIGLRLSSQLLSCLCPRECIISPNVN